MKIYNNLISNLFLFFVFFFTFSALSKNINISGNKFIDEDVILSIINDHIDNSNDNNVNSIIKKLKNTNGISDVIINFDKDNLNIQIIENLKILDITFEGNERFKKSEFLELINYKKYLDFYNENDIYLYIQELEKLYLSFGFNQISIDYDIIKLENDNFINIIFIIDEGNISKINKIYFLGNESFKSNELKKIIKSRQTNILKFYSNSNFKLYEANNDLIRINDFYKSKGYRNINVKLKTEYIADKNKFNLYFSIHEGSKYFFDKIDLNFEIKESENIIFHDVQKILDKYLEKIFKSDKVYNIDHIFQMKENISSYLFENGQMFFEIETLEKIDKNIVNIKFNIISVSPIYINKINIYGNTRTIDKVIRREFIIAEGDASNSFLIQKSYKNIEKLNFFKSIEITETNIDNELIDINIHVEEKTTGDFKIGAAFGSLNGVSFMAGLNEKNIGGVGRNFELAVDTSDKNTIYKLNVVEPYIFNKKLNLIYGLNYSNKDFSNSASYKLDKLEVKTGLNYMITEDFFHSVILKYNIKDYQITDSSAASQSIIDSDGTNAEWSINNIFTLNELNSYFRPTSGSYYSINSILSPITNSTNGYIKNIFTQKNYYKINKHNILSIQSRIGNIVSLQNSVVTTDNKFALGGRWLRGFDSLGAGPRDSYSSYVGGNNIFVSKIDLSRPLNNMSDNPIDLNIFTDIGKVWENKNTPVNSNESIRASYGLGVKFYSPVGPVGFSWAFPLMDESYDNKRMFLFTIGDLN